MMKYILFISLLSALCSCSSNNGRLHTDQGVTYEIHDFDVDGRKAKPGDYLIVYMKWYNATDSLMYNSIEQSLNGVDIIHLGKSDSNKKLEETLLELSENDSVSIYLPSGLFFKDYLNLEIPNNMSENEEVEVVLRLKHVFNYIEFTSYQDELSAIAEMQELKAVENVLGQWSEAGDSIVDLGGVYFVSLSEKIDSLDLGFDDRVAVDYSAEFLDGTIFYSTVDNGGADEFQLGRSGQTTKGLEKVLLNMSYGQHGKALIPSYMGFGEQYAVGGLIKPYTPLIYFLHVNERDSLL